MSPQEVHREGPSDAVTEALRARAAQFMQNVLPQETLGFDGGGTGGMAETTPGGTPTSQGGAESLSPDQALRLQNIARFGYDIRDAI